MEREYIRLGKSLFRTPVLFVSKKDGQLWMSIDYQALNKVTVKNNYLMLRVDDLLDTFTSAKTFNCIDLKFEYY